MIRYFAQVEYEGTHYHGFQSQRNTKKTVQYHLEEALGKVGNERLIKQRSNGQSRISFK